MDLFPTEIPAGLPFSARLELPEYPAPAWAVTVYLRGPQAVDIDAVPDGSAHLASASAELTADWPPGRYWYAVRAVKGADVKEAGRGQVQILADLAQAAAGFDGRSDNERALDAIKAILANRASKDQQSYKINNRELVRMSVSELLKLRGFYASQVRIERRKASGSGGSFGRSIPVRMN